MADQSLVRIDTRRIAARLSRFGDTKVGGVVTVVTAALAYFGVRHLSNAHLGTALRHAHKVQGFERHLGIYHEVWFQRQFLPHGWMITVADDMYIYGHWPVIAVALTWLLFRHHHQFLVARNALLLSGAVALVIFAVFPVAPPRLADPGIVDTVTVHTNAYRVLQPPSLTDNFAAMPSLHCGWDLLVALSVRDAARRRWLRYGIMVVPVLMALAVVVSGNHYFIDVVVGDVLATGAYLFARAHTRRRATTAPAADRSGARPAAPDQSGVAVTG